MRKEAGSSSLVDEIERLGAMVSAQEMGAAEAAHVLQQFSDGGLTYIGAAEALGRWRTVRADYRAVFDTVQRHLDEMKES